MSGKPTFSFPYQQEISGTLGKSLRPRLPLQLKTKSGKWVTVSFYVDTGADISMLPRSTSDILGINLKSGNEVIVVGLAGELIRAYLHDLECKIEGLDQFTMKFAISEKESVVPILGREGIFQRFNIRFNNVASQVELDPL